MGVGIALGPWSQPREGGTGLNINPMSFMMDAMRVRQGMQEFNARQSLGGIMATSPDIDTAIKRYSQDPSAGFYPEGMTELRNLQLLQSQLKTQELERGRIGAETTRATTATAGLQINNAMDVHKQSLAMSMNDSSQLEANTTNLLNMLPEGSQREEARALLEARNHSLLDGLDKMSPADARSTYWMRTHGMLVGSGFNSDEIYKAHGLLPGQVVTGPYGPGGRTAAVPAFGYPAPSYAGGPSYVGGGATPPPEGFTPGPEPRAPGQPAGVGNMLGGYPIPMGPSMAEQKEFEGRGTQMAAYREDLDNRVESGASLMANLSEAKDLMSAFTPGPNYGKYIWAAGVASSMGAGPDVVKAIAGGDLSAAQAFQKLTTTQAMSQLESALPHGSRANIREWNAFVASNPNWEMLPDAINTVFDYWGRTFVRNRMEQKALQGFTKAGGDMDEWPDKWQSIQERKGLLGVHLTGTDKTKGIPPGDVIKLLGNDDPESRKVFDKKHGPGSAAKFLDTESP